MPKKCRIFGGLRRSWSDLDVRRKAKYRTVRRPPSLDEIPTIGAREAGLLFNMSRDRFIRIFFQTDLCDRVEHGMFGQRGYRFNFPELLRAAFPELTDEARAVMMVYHLRAEYDFRFATLGAPKQEKLKKGA